MVTFAKAHTPSKKMNLYSQLALWAIAAFFLLMAVGQLIDLRGFVDVLQTYRLPTSDATTGLIAAVLVITEVFALPFFLRMRLSHLMRWFSMLCGWIAALLWIGLLWWALSNYLTPANVGYFGSFIKWPMNTLALLYGAFLLVVVGLSSRLLRHDFDHRHKKH